MSFEIVDDTDWKKPDVVWKEVSCQCLKFFSEWGIEPHYANCLIRWKDSYNTVEVRIAIEMHSGAEEDIAIFFFCNYLENMKLHTEIDYQDFFIADCYGFGLYENYYKP